MSTKKLIIFDFDGVIEETTDFVIKMFRTQIPDLAIEEFRSWFDGNFYQTIKEKNVPFDAEEYYSKYEAWLPSQSIRPEMKAVLTELREHVALAIVSSSHDDALNRYLERNGIANLFDQVWGVQKNKGKVEKLTGLLEIHDVPPEEAVFVTDTLGDILEAREVGIESVAVTWGFHPKERLLKGDPRGVVGTPRELLEFLLHENV